MNNTRSFIVFEFCGRTDSGEMIAEPIGVELAICCEQAHIKACRRWPERTLLEPEPWEKVPLEIRIKALNADRNHVLHIDVGILI